MNTADRLAILEAIQLYSYAIDSRDIETYIDLFTENAVFKVVRGFSSQPFIHAEGRNGVREWITATTMRWGDVQTRHHQTNTIFDSLSENTARTRTMLLESRAQPGESAVIAYTQGVYTDDWTYEAGVWRIARRALHLDTGSTATDGETR
jgi:3-phenylpropionate/cinnamic acid dioxygenase small subunit